MQKYTDMLDDVFRDYWRRPKEEIQNAHLKAREDFSRVGFSSPLAFDTYYVAYADQLIGECEIDYTRKILKGTAVDSDLEEYKNNIQRSLDLFDMIPIFEGDVGKEETDRRMKERIQEMYDFAKEFKPFENLCQAWLDANVNKQYHESLGVA